MHNTVHLTVEQRIRRAKENNHGLRLDRVDACELQKLFETREVKLDDSSVGRRCKKAVEKSQKLRLSHDDVSDLRQLLNIN